MFKQLTLILMLLLIGAQSSKAQIWTKDLGLKGKLHKILRLDNGDLLITGSTNYTSQGVSHDTAFLLCTNPKGESKWIKTWSKNHDSTSIWLTSIMPYKMGYIYYYVTTYDYPTYAQLYTYVFLDTNFNAILDTTPVFNGYNSSTFFQEIESDSTLLFKCQDTYCTYIVRTDNNFKYKETLWYPDPGFGIPSKDKPRKYLKSDPQSAGILLWDDHTNIIASYNEPGFTFLHRLTTPLKKNQWLSWDWSNWPSTNFNDLNLIKFDDKLDTLWTLNYRTLIPIYGKNYYANNAIETSDEGTLLAGDISDTYDEQGPFITKLDKWGNLEWQHGVGFGRGSTAGYDMIEDKSGYLVLAQGLNWSDSHDQMYLVHIPFNGKTEGIENKNSPKESSVFIWPNPAKSVLHTGVKGNTQFEIIDVNGAVVNYGITTNGEIDIQMLEPGFYILKSQMNDGYHIGKFIKSVGQ